MSQAKGTFAIKQINNEIVRKVPLKEPEDTRLAKGHRLFPELNANIGIIAKKNSGKSTVINTTIRRCAGPNTKIYVFCSTLDYDKNWIAIRDWAREKGIYFEGHTSIVDSNKVNHLKLIIDELIELKEEQQNETTPEKKWGDESDDEEEEKPRRSKYQEPEYMFILDDLSTEIKNPSVAALLKINRHFHSKTILSSQFLNDLKPDARLQLDYYLLFKGLPRLKIDDVYSKADLSLPLDDFNKMYHFATEEPYSFLYIDVRKDKFRRNFNTSINI
jgi:hypothetical protein